MKNINDKYKLVNCPICDKSLENGALVICPDCGAPYHRTCFMKEQQCIYPELHATGKDWVAPKSAMNEALENNNANQFPKDKLENIACTCTRCGTVNPPSGVFCQICGNKLIQNPLNPTDKDNFPVDRFEPSSQNTSEHPQNPIPLNHIVNPLGGLAPTETIDGISAKELAVFVGRGSHYYLPKFKEMSQNRGAIINFAAFFFTGGFFLYRKMFAIGLIFCFFDVLFSIPSSILLYQDMTTQMISGTKLVHGNEMLYNLNSVCSFLVLTLRFICGYFANNLYKEFVFKKIKDIKALNLPESEYYKTLSKSGSVAIGLIRFVLCFYLLFNFIFILFLLV